MSHSQRDIIVVFLESLYDRYESGDDDAGDIIVELLTTFSEYFSNDIQNEITGIYSIHGAARRRQLRRLLTALEKIILRLKVPVTDNILDEDVISKHASDGQAKHIYPYSTPSWMFSIAGVSAEVYRRLGEYFDLCVSFIVSIPSGLYGYLKPYFPFMPQSVVGKTTKPRSSSNSMRSSTDSLFKGHSWEYYSDNVLRIFSNRNDEIGEALMHLRLGQIAQFEGMLNAARNHLANARYIAKAHKCIDIEAVVDAEIIKLNVVTKQIEVNRTPSLILKQDLEENHHGR